MLGIMLQLLLLEHPPKDFPSQLLSTKNLLENIPGFNMAVQYFPSQYSCVLHRLVCGPLSPFAATIYSVFNAWTLFTAGTTLSFVNIFRIFLIVKVEYFK